MRYRSLNTVFSVTRKSGATTSLKTAEKRLKERSLEDQCYYNTYIKLHDLTYETDGGLIEGQVSLRRCVLIAMWDNLLRLSYQRDPVPGDCRSHQICTLPITIQGLPEDSKIIESWHDHGICDGSISCACKRMVTHTPLEVSELLIKLSPSEKTVLQRFSQLCTWTNNIIWKEMEFLNGK